MNTLWKKQPFWSKYSDRNVERAGRKDGSLSPPIPPWNAPVLPPHAWELVHAGDSDIQLLKQHWAKKDETLLPDFQTKAYQAATAQTEADNAEHALTLAEAAYEAAHGGKPAPTDRRFGLYRWTIAALTLAEIPFNAIVFRSIGETEVMTLAFTIALAASVVGAAHFLGVFLHRLRSAGGKLIRKHVLFALLLTLIPLGVVGSIAVFRAERLSHPRPTEAMSDDAATINPTTTISPTVTATRNLNPPAQTGSASPVAQSGLPDNRMPNEASVAEAPESQGSSHFEETPALVSFFFFNLLLFLVATAYAYSVHDELLATVYRRRGLRRGALKTLAGRQRRLVQARGRREMKHMECCAQAHQVVKNINRKIDGYRTHNLRQREDRGDHPGRYPECFDKYGVPNLPPELTTLEWPDEAVQSPVKHPGQATDSQTERFLTEPSSDVAAQEVAAPTPATARQNAVYAPTLQSGPALQSGPTQNQENNYEQENNHVKNGHSTSPL